MAGSQSPDVEDVELTRRGDREAFGRLFDRHAAAVRAVAAAVSGDFGAVEDLTQETFLRAYGRLGSLRDPAAFGPWVRGIARQVGREHRRSALRPRLLQASDELAAVAGDDPSAAVVGEEDRRQVQQALQQLPERERLALHAYYFHQQQADEAAAELGLSRSGFYAVLRRAHQKLRSSLRETNPARHEE